MAIPIDDVDGFFAEADVENDHPYSKWRQQHGERERAAAQDASDAAWTSLVIEAPTEWYEQRPPRRSWLLRDPRRDGRPGVLPMGKVGQIIGAGGSSKTMACFQLAVAVSTATRWLDCFEVATHGRVLVVVGEEDQDECRRRLYHATQVARVVPGDGAISALPLAGVPAPMVESDGYGNFRDGPFGLWLRDYVEREGFVLVVVDPLSRFGGREAESENSAATRFIQALEGIASAGGATVLNAHHTNQLSRGGGRVNATSGRGVTGLVDGARWQCALDVESIDFDNAEDHERIGEIVTFAVTKSNYARKPDPVVLRHDHTHGGALVALDALDTARVNAARGADPIQEARQATKRAETKTEADAQDKAVLKAVAERPWINQTALRDRVRALSGCGDPAARVAIARMKDQLAERPGPNRSTLYARKGVAP